MINCALSQLVRMGLVSTGLCTVLKSYGCWTSAEVLALAHDQRCVREIATIHGLLDEFNLLIKQIETLPDNPKPVTPIKPKSQSEDNSKASIEDKPFTVCDYTEIVLLERNNPISLKELVLKILNYLPSTNENSVRANLSTDKRKRFVFFINGYVGLKDVEYSSRYLITNSENRLLYYTQQKIEEFFSFIEKTHRSPQPHGLDEEENLYRWYVKFLKDKTALTANLKAEFLTKIKDYEEWIFTPNEYSYKKYCDQLEWYVEENIEMPTNEVEPELFSWFNSQLGLYKNHKDKRKNMFQNLLVFLDGYGFHYYDINSSEGREVLQKNKRRINQGKNVGIQLVDDSNVNRREETPLSRYENRFAELATDSESLYKKILLLTIINLVERGLVVDNHIQLNSDLLTTYIDTCIEVLDTVPSQNIAMPFFSLKDERFWKLVPNENGSALSFLSAPPSFQDLNRMLLYAEISEELFALLKEKDTQSTLRRALDASYDGKLTSPVGLAADADSKENIDVTADYEVPNIDSANDYRNENASIGCPAQLPDSELNKDSSLIEYSAYFKSLDVSMDMGEPAPHKAILLITVMQLIRNGHIKSQFFEADNVAVDLFNENWERYVGIEKNNNCNFWLPYLNMRTEPFWMSVQRFGVTWDPDPNIKLDKKSITSVISGAYLPGALLRLAKDDDSYSQLLDILMSTYIQLGESETTSSSGKLHEQSLGYYVDECDTSLIFNDQIRPFKPTINNDSKAASQQYEVEIENLKTVEQNIQTKLLTPKVADWFSANGISHLPYQIWHALCEWGKSTQHLTTTQCQFVTKFGNFVKSKLYIATHEYNEAASILDSAVSKWHFDIERLIRQHVFKETIAPATQKATTTPVLDSHHNYAIDKAWAISIIEWNNATSWSKRTGLLSLNERCTLWTLSAKKKYGEMFDSKDADIALKFFKFIATLGYDSTKNYASSTVDVSPSKKSTETSSADAEKDFWATIEWDNIQAWQRRSQSLTFDEMKPLIAFAPNGKAKSAFTPQEIKEIHQLIDLVTQRGFDPKTNYRTSTARISKGKKNPVKNPRKVYFIEDIPYSVWSEMADWGVETKKLSLEQVRLARLFGNLRSSNLAFSADYVKKSTELWNEAKIQGFKTKVHLAGEVEVEESASEPELGLEGYRQYFLNLHVSRNAGQCAPHKAILLITLMRMIRSGRVVDNTFTPNKHALNLFQEVWEKYVSKASQYHCNFWTPYWHMRSEPFWTIIPRLGDGWRPFEGMSPTEKNVTEVISGVRLPAEFCELVKDDAAFAELLDVLVTKYLS